MRIHTNRLSGAAALVLLLVVGFSMIWYNTPATDLRASEVTAQTLTTRIGSASKSQISSPGFFADKLLALFTTVAGSFAGAYFAFRLQRLRAEEERNDQRVAALNNALFQIFRMWNALRQYQREHLEPFRGRRDGWLNLSATPVAQHAAVQFEGKELSFLLSTPKNNVFARVMLEEERYRLATALIEKRSELVLKEVFPRMSKAGIAVRENRDERDVEKILGIDIAHQLRQLTDHIFSFVDADEKSLREVYDELRSVAKGLFPTKAFIKVDWNSEKA
jgi:hypothetical protein